jgi:type I restriction enzyme M protein
VAQAQANFLETLEKWWSDNLPHVEALAPTDGKKGNMYELRRLLLSTITGAFAHQTLLNEHQVRGAFANYLEVFKPDLNPSLCSAISERLKFQFQTPRFSTASPKSFLR